MFVQRFEWNIWLVLWGKDSADRLCSCDHSTSSQFIRYFIQISALTHSLLRINISQALWTSFMNIDLNYITCIDIINILRWSSPDVLPLLMCGLSFLKLPSLFAAWPFWTFHTKSHNMKVLVILSHSWSPFLSLTCFYGKKVTFVGLCAAFWSIFLRENYPQITHANHMTMTTSGPIYSWPDYRKTKENVNITLLDLCLFTFSSYMPMSPHGIGYKQTWYPADIR